MKKYVKAVVVALALSMIFCGGQVLAGNGKGFGGSQNGGSGAGDRDKARDGSCLDSILIETGSLLLAGQNGNQSGDRDGTPDQDRSRDGSCLDSILTGTGSLLLAGQNGNQSGERDGTPDQDRRRDDSCLDS